MTHHVDYSTLLSESTSCGQTAVDEFLRVTGHRVLGIVVSRAVGR